MNDPVSGPPAVDAGKAAWRRWARTLPPVDTDVAVGVVAHLRRFLDGVTGQVCAYIALPDEVDLDGLLSARSTAGIRWVLPRIGDDGVLSVHVDDGRRLSNRFGLQEPMPDAPSVDVSTLTAILVPGRVFDHRGVRLGRGGGHYDRLVPQLETDVPVIGVTTSSRIVDALPVEAHDRTMTHLASEHGVTPIRP